MEHTTTLMLLNEAEEALWSAVRPLRLEVRRQEGELSAVHAERVLDHLEAVEQALERVGSALKEVQGHQHHFKSRVAWVGPHRAVDKSVEIGDAADHGH